MCPVAHKLLPAAGPVAELAEERARTCQEFTASLFLTAWKSSAALKLPAW
jgi:hypothetical protein